MKLSVVIPVYNEKDTITTVIDRVAATPFDKEIIVVDDCSKDGTRDVLKALDRPGVRVFFHEVNQGKGGALRTGFSQVQGDIVLIQDADLEYTPDDYGALIKPITDGNADVVFGSRFLGGTHRCHLFWHYVVNKGLTTISNVFTNLNVSDMETCYKVFRREVADRIKIESNRFGVEPELTAKVARLRCRVYEVPISYFGRDYSEGKKIGWKDGFDAIWSILKFNLFSARPEPLPRKPHAEH
ncbi:MAG: glycosyltransferase family 2 protein [Planctomycetes bacterium]|nr:glycosyltransferase family 2 protein [Planctomycetota bacterium]MCC7172683.1 glycosyltransferase family 2 protein [Planctomycetota bacterium]